MSAIVRGYLKNYYDLDESTKLDLDIAIETLSKSGELNERDLLQIALTIEQATASDISRMVGIKRSAINNRLSVISSKIANFLGKQYQDDKILEEVSRRLKRPLTEAEEKFCWEVINRGCALGKNTSILNFKVNENGKITSGENKEEG